MIRPLISVIMPCYNAEAFVEESIECVFQQTYPNVELIVINDGSTDRSSDILLELAKKHPALTVLTQQNLGPYPARNLALEHAKGEFIAFLDADDYWAPSCLEKLYQAILQNDADLSYCGWQNVVEGGTDGPPYVPPAYEEADIFQSFLEGCPWPIHAALVRRIIVDKADGFSTRCFSAMDYDFWIRLSAITQKIVRVPEVLAFYRWHNYGQISSVKWKQVLDSWRVRKDFVEQNGAAISHIPTEKLEELVDGYVLAQAYAAFWKRDLASAQQLFRASWFLGNRRIKDLKYIAFSFLPTFLFDWLIHYLDR